ncbi:MAG: type II toxin-antitoxin system HigB family toxin [Bacteroidaceae bacterium]|nr:type II toxin-antitoxin system HigB family toxin [Bacteroidaceae bacterium]
MLVVLIQLLRQKVYVRWIGRHKDYDKIDCSTI